MADKAFLFQSFKCSGFNTTLAFHFLLLHFVPPFMQSPHTYFDSSLRLGKAQDATSEILVGNLYVPGPGTCSFQYPTTGRLLVPKPNDGAEALNFSDELTYDPGPGTIDVVSFKAIILAPIEQIGDLTLTIEASG